MPFKRGLNFAQNFHIKQQLTQYSVQLLKVVRTFNISYHTTVGIQPKRWFNQMELRVQLAILYCNYKSFSTGCKSRILPARQFKENPSSPLCSTTTCLRTKQSIWMTLIILPKRRHTVQQSFEVEDPRFNASSTTCYTGILWQVC